jgi:hypothetical protein
MDGGLWGKVTQAGFLTYANNLKVAVVRGIKK